VRKQGLIVDFTAAKTTANGPPIRTATRANLFLLIPKSTANRVGISGPPIRLMQGPPIRLRGLASSATSPTKKKHKRPAQSLYIMIGSTSAGVPASGKGRVTIKLNRPAARKLGTLQRLPIVIRLVLSDAAGHHSTIDGTTTLRR
jgi:hypothetical protein